MRHSPVLTVDAAELPDEARRAVERTVGDAASTGTLDLSQLPEDVRQQVLFALDSIARGRQVAAVSSGKPLTTTEAAALLGMSRTHLARLCNEGRIPSHKVGNSRRIDADVVLTILSERSRARTEATEAVATADERRRRRAARAAGIDVE